MTVATALRRTGVSGFDPLTLSPSLWLDASDTATITSTGGRVSAWADKSTSAYSFAQGTSGRQPATGSTTINGLNVLTFDGSRSLYANAVQMTSASTGLATVIAVFRPTTLSGLHIVINSDVSPRLPQWIRLNASGNVEFITIDGGFTTCTGFFGIPTSTVHAVTARATGAKTQLFNNGGTPSENTSAAWSYTSASQTVVGRYYESTLYGFVGDIAEILSFQRALSAADHNLIGSYLATKWGFTWTNVS